MLATVIVCFHSLCPVLGPQNSCSPFIHALLVLTLQILAWQTVYYYFELC